VKTIGLISDTHGYLDDAVFTHFEKCDEIWHAGDFGNLDLANALSDFKPLRGVYGNIDGQDIRQMYPETLRFSIEELDVFMIHIGGYPNRYTPIVKEMMLNKPPQLFISGHSHILKVIYDKNFKCLHLNPGAAGKQGWHKVRTLQRFSIDEGKVQNLEVIELSNRY
jgi:putative phosphoesterase